VLAIIGSHAVSWTCVLALPGRAPLWLLVVLSSDLGLLPWLDGRLRLRAPLQSQSNLGSCQGMVNWWLPVASLLVMQA